MKNIILSLLLVLGLSACGEKSETPKENEKPTIKIGVNLPMSGNMAYAGENLSQALKMGLDDISKEQNLKYKYELLIEDNVFDIKKTVNNLHRMKSINKVNVLMSLWGTDGILTADFAQKNSLLHFSCSLSDKVGDGKYTFNHATTPKTHMQELIKYIKESKYKNVGILYDNALEIEEFVEKLKPMLSENKINTAFSYSINVGETDLRQLIVKMKDKNPDVIFVWNAPPALMTFAKQRKEGNLNTPLISINLFSFVPELYEGEVFLTEDNGGKNFADKFNTYSNLQVMPCTVNFYDSIKMIVNAYENSVVNNNEAIPEVSDISKMILNQQSGYKSILNIKIDEKGNIDSKSIVKKIINGKPVVVEE